MAEDFDFSDLGDIGDLYGEENLIDLLYNVQETQNKSDQSKKNGLGGLMPDFSGDSDTDSVASENLSALSVDNDDFTKVLDGLDLDSIETTVEKKVIPKSIDEYDKSIYSFPQLDEIKKGIDRGLDVTYYDSADLMFRQMREIRMGLEANLDVSVYANKYYRDRQMREIRLGLMEGLDVSNYARLICSLSDMRKAHQKLFTEQFKISRSKLDYTIKDYSSGVSVHTKDGHMKAYFKLTEKLPDDFTVPAFFRLIDRMGITNGFCIDSETMNLADYEIGKEYLLAEGEEPAEGVDGYFEYFFESFDEPPKVKEDGSIDYRAQKELSAIKAGEKIALYHKAKPGKSGFTVSGREILSYVGHDLEPLKANFIHCEEDGVTYISEKGGYVTLQKGKLSIFEQLEIKGDVVYGKDNIKFNGTIHITGSVMKNAKVEADGDIIVDGYVEGARLKAGKNIIIRRGVNGNNVGIVEARGNIVAAFFENTNIVAGGNIEAGYLMNSMAYCRDSVKVAGKKPLICGGKVKASNSVTAGVVGNDSHARTEIEVGRLTDYGEQLLSINQRMKALDADMERIRDGMNAILGKVGALKGRTHPSYLKLEDALEQQKKQFAALREEQRKLDGKINGTSDNFIRVTDVVYENTLIKLNGSILLTDKDSRNVRFCSQGRHIIIQ